MRNIFRTESVVAPVTAVINASGIIDSSFFPFGLSLILSFSSLFSSVCFCASASFPIIISVFSFALLLT
jgi:hypothetical protein